MKNRGTADIDKLNADADVPLDELYNNQDNRNVGKGLKINLEKAKLKHPNMNESAYGSLFDGIKKQERHHSENSCNSLNFEAAAVRSLVNKKIRDNMLPMPPTKASLAKLFQLMNIEVSPVKLLDCLIYCRGKKMEQSVEPEDYDSAKLVQWLVLNIRTFKHADMK